MKRNLLIFHRVATGASALVNTNNYSIGLITIWSHQEYNINITSHLSIFDMQSQGHDDKEKDSQDAHDNEDKSFDLGPLWSLNPEVSLADFKNCIIDELSIKYLMLAIKENTEQRFTIYGKIKKMEDSPSIFYLFCQPSVDADISREEFAKREAIYGKGNIIKAGNLTVGVVHVKTRKLRAKEAKKNNPELYDLLTDSSNNIEVGLSCNFNPADLSFLVINRSTMNFSTCYLNQAAKFALLPPFEMDYDLTKFEFYNKSDSLSMYLERSIMFEIQDIIINALNTAIDHKLAVLNDPTIPVKTHWVKEDKEYNTNTARFAQLWDDVIRCNITAFTEYMLFTLYVSACVRNEKSASTWTVASDEDVIKEVFTLAEMYDIELDLDRTYFPNFYISINGTKTLFDEKINFGHTALMGLAKKGCSIKLIETFIQNGSDIFKKDKSGRDALSYAIESKQTNLASYLALHQLMEYVIFSEYENANDFLENVYNKNILLLKTNINDPAGNIFISTTLFQYALWAFDIEMCKILLNHFSDPKDAQTQLEELEKNGLGLYDQSDLKEGGTLIYEKHFDMTPLTNALKRYVDHKASDEEKQKLWLDVGIQQKKLPAYFAKYYLTDDSEPLRSWFYDDKLGKEFTHLCVFYRNSTHLFGGTLKTIQTPLPEKNQNQSCNKNLKQLTHFSKKQKNQYEEFTKVLFTKNSTLAR